MIRKIIILFSVFFLSLSPGMAEKSPEAEAFVIDVSNRVIDILSNASTTEKEDAFRTLLNEKSNLKRIAAFTLGKYRRQLSPAELQELFSRNELIKKFAEKKYLLSSPELETLLGEENHLKIKQYLLFEWRNWRLIPKDKKYWIIEKKED